MEILTGTVIGKRQARSGDALMNVEILYETDSYGFARLPNGDLKKIEGQQYAEQLAKFKRELDVNNTIDPPEDLPDEPENVPVENELVSKASRYQKEKEKKEKEERNNTRTDSEKQKKDAGTTHKKKIPMPVIILVVIVIIALGVLVYAKFFAPGSPGEVQPETPAVETESNPPDDETEPETTYTIAVLRADIELGTMVMAEDFEPQVITEDEYTILAGTVYIDRDGNEYTGTVLLYDDVDAVAGKVARRDLSAGRGLTLEDFADAEEELTGQMTVRMVAIVSSETLEEDLVLELGQYVITSGAIEDILNTNGKSVINKSPAEITTKETETTVNPETEKAEEEVSTWE